MKKILFLLMAVLAITSGFAQEYDTIPNWLADMQKQNKGLIDSLAVYPKDPKGKGYCTFVIYYHQPLLHAQPDGAQFPMRALITFNRDSDPTKAINHVYCSGYGIMPEMTTYPDSFFVHTLKDGTTEIAQDYNANYISIEHRYFEYSAPSRCWENLDPLTAEEAAADFHNLFEGMKKVLKGKWVMSGASKGGITTLLQHTFYPEDMDIYLPYSAPFFESVADTTMYTYWYNKGWNKEYLDLFQKIRKAGIAKMVYHTEQNGMWQIYSFLYSGTAPSQGRIDTLYGNYISSVAGFGFLAHAYNDTVSLRKQTAANDSIIRSNGWTNYNDTALAYMLIFDKYSLKDMGPWLDTLRKYSNLNKKPALRLPRQANIPFGISEKDWWFTPDKSSNRAYHYQSKRELGYYDYRFDEIASTPEDAAFLNDFWVTKCNNLRDLTDPCFYTLSFSRNLYDRMMAATKNATKPIIFIYGEDDSWTGSAIKDEFVNGQNVRKYILPGQNHLVSYSSNTDPTQCAAIRAMLNEVLNQTQDVENVQGEKGQGTKVIRDGQLYLMYEGKMYNIQGSRVR